jgi:thioredoxin reductase
MTADVVVLGAGPAGANAALAAAGAGASVVLVDEGRAAGGQVWRPKGPQVLSAPRTAEGDAGDALRGRLAQSSVERLADARVWHIERTGDLWTLHSDRGGAWRRVTGRALVIAAGAREEVTPVPGWTLPGVIGLAGATALMKEHLVVPPGPVVVAGAGPLVFFAAAEIRRLGGAVALVATANRRRDWVAAAADLVGQPGLALRGASWIAGLRAAGVPVLWGHAVAAVEGADEVEAVRVVTLDGRGTERRIAARSLCLGGRLVPNAEAAALAGVPLRFDPLGGAWVPAAGEDGGTDRPGLFVCGDGAGVRGAAAAGTGGALAGLAAARHAGFVGARDLPALRARHARAARFGARMAALAAASPAEVALTTPGTIVCRCEGVTAGALLAEAGDGAGELLALKSGTRIGMGPCGGRFCLGPAARLVEAARGLPPGSLRPPTPRPPLRPVAVSVLAASFAYEDLPMPKPSPP